MAQRRFSGGILTLRIWVLDKRGTWLAAIYPVSEPVVRPRPKNQPQETSVLGMILTFWDLGHLHAACLAVVQ
jgi:hypothetical protein